VERWWDGTDRGNRVWSVGGMVLTGTKGSAGKPLSVPLCAPQTGLELKLITIP
jgi:hypothetical protein